MAQSSSGTEMRRTLSLTGLTVNAMALIAPGAFLWTTFQVQAAQANGDATTAMDMWPGLLVALVLAFLTAISYAELANIYPHAGAGSSYFFAEAAFLDKEAAHHRKWARLSKFVIGWISHLYYWIYPGIMVAFSATLIVYILGLFGLTLETWAQMLVAVVFAILNGAIAYRGISGSTLTALVINVVQLTALVAFSVLAIVFRMTHPELNYDHPMSMSVVMPHDLNNVLFQSIIAILLLVGFESVTALGAEAMDPKKDIKRAILLSLFIQGLFAYLFEYFAANLMVSSALTATTAAGEKVTGYAATAASSAPIGDMMQLIGDQMLGGTGLILTVILAGTVVLALIGTTLACLNTGVRITYAMGRDNELPSVLGILHAEHATPHVAIWILVAVAAIFGAYGVIGVDQLTQITLASNIGTFIVYGFTNLIALVAFLGHRDQKVLQHIIVPLLGLIANLAMLGAIAYLSLAAGGATSSNTTIAIGVDVVWLAIGGVFFVINSSRTGRALLEHQPTPSA